MRQIRSGAFWFANRQKLLPDGEVYSFARMHMLAKPVSATGTAKRLFDGPFSLIPRIHCYTKAV